MAIRDKNHSREIITKAICGKGRKFSVVTHTVTPPHNPTSILGAWIINHQYEAVRAGDGIEVIGTYDINIWYSYNNNSQTDVAKETVSYADLVSLAYVDPHHRAATVEVAAEATQEPSCVEATVSSSGTSVVIRVEREFLVEMVAETKVWVVVNPNGASELEDKYLDFSSSSSSDDYEDLEPYLPDEET
ncbi:outer spore coat protein CotE [Paenibacillus sp. SC116]|uniref:outer spore coat protein CotE n=1 Tax=Paenibacillus sp. SC116 TaxID=2968986 RepID=UPI00215A8161|nr:outer spore coat protein CotE [Paenibacillus sp. SC116]MCR8842848.1 outer spore coat protein CotE [Paenibacillus sp. SC116]